MAEQYDINKEVAEQFQEQATQMERRILGGEVLKEATNSDGEKIVVTLTENGKYGYAVYEPYSDEPHYLVEGEVLLQDLDKRTASNGITLRYPGAKSMIQRNMVGLFSEYIKDPGFEGFYISCKSPESATLKVTQQMTGYYKEDPVQLFGVSFRDKTFSYAAEAQLYIDPQTGEPTLRVGMGGLNPDGSPDYETTVRMAREAEQAKRFFGERAMGNEELHGVIKNSIITAQSVFYQMYEGMGLPMSPEAAPCTLLEDGLNGRDISRYMGEKGFQNPVIEDHQRK